MLALVLTGCAGNQTPAPAQSEAVTGSDADGASDESAAETADDNSAEAASDSDAITTAAESSEAESGEAVSTEPESTVPAAAELDPLLDLKNYSDKWEYVTEQPKSQRGEFVLDENGNMVYEPVQPCYVLWNVPYCLNPADAEVELLDIYVPAEYMDARDNGNGTFTCTVNRNASFKRADGTVYTGANAPVIVQNTIDGYAEGARLQLTSGRKGGGVGTYNSYLESGYVLVSIGSRGIGSVSDGTAPACVVDLKAGIRMIKANADIMAGDINRIVATGTSAGGGVTSVLGASGNSAVYDSYLEEIGAVMDSTDDIYCAMAFCPITNLDTGDAAFEWLHATETASTGGFGGMMGGPGAGGPGAGGPGAGGPDMMGGGAASEPEEFSEFEVALHEALIDAFKQDLKDMGIDPDEFEKGFLDKINECITYYAENYDGEQYTVEDIGTFVTENMGRKKGVPSFDGLDSGNKENQLFDSEHFSAELLEILEDLAPSFPEAAEATDAFKAQLTDQKLKEVQLMTPNYFILGGESDIAPFWRFRNGTMDGDLGSVSAWTMTNLLEKKGGFEIDYGLVWGVGHMSADYSYDDVQTYIDSICK